MKNIIFLIVDTLRYDRLGISGYKPDLTPNLNDLATGGINCTNCFSAGCVTSVAFPSIFTSTLPLDYGGYDEGILNRPVSFPEILSNNGFETYGITTGHPCSSHFGYNRGYKNFVDLVDLYQWFRSVYVAYLNDHLAEWKNGKNNESELLKEFSKKYHLVLRDSQRYINSLNMVNAPHSGRSRSKLLDQVSMELELLDKYPELIIEKLHLLKADYQFALGERNISTSLQSSINRKNKISSILNKRIFILSNRRAFEAKTVNKVFEKWLEKPKKSPFFASLHYFDLHEAKLLASRMLSEPKLDRVTNNFSGFLKAQKGRSRNQHGLFYDIGLSLIDKKIGELRNILSNHGLLDNTTLVITGDHGTEAGFPHRGLGSNLARLFYDEHLHVPLIINGPNIPSRTEIELVSHIDIAPSILSLAGLNSSEFFQGKEIISPISEFRDAVWSENTGLGRCKIKDKSLFISYRTKTHKSISKSDNFIPVITELYDLYQDPHELKNLVNDPNLNEIKITHKRAIQNRVDQLKNQK